MRPLTGALRQRGAALPPIRIAVGKRGLADGKIEWKLRSDSQVEMVAIGELAARVSAPLGR